MSIKYKVVKQVFNFDQTATEKFVARAVIGEMLPFEKVCNQVCQISGMHRAIVPVVLGGLLDVLVNNLGMGHSVQLDQFGTFRPGIQSKAQKSEEEATVDTIYRQKVTFVPGKMLKSFLNDVSVTRIDIPEVDYTNNNSKNTL